MDDLFSMSGLLFVLALVLLIASPLLMAWVAQLLADTAAGSEKRRRTGGFEVMMKTSDPPPSRDEGPPS